MLNIKLLSNMSMPSLSDYTILLFCLAVARDPVAISRMEARGPVVIDIIRCCKYESVNNKQLKNILLIFSFLSSNYYYFGRHIDIKSIKLFDY